MKTVGIVGATGAVGREVLDIFEKRKFPVKSIVPFGSTRSLGKPVVFDGKSYPAQILAPGCFKGLDLIFFDASDAVSKQWVEEALASGAWVIDNSATYRMTEGVPLIVPEVNAHEITSDLPRKLIAGPNCTVAPMVVALKPILDRWGLERLVISTYQSTSGGGTAAMQELIEQTRGTLSGQTPPNQIFSHQIAFNCIPHIGGFKDDDYTSEEQKTVLETRKILNFPDLRVTATCVRVPTLRCHAEAINVETARPFEIEEVKEALRSFPGLQLCDDPKAAMYPMGLTLPSDRVPAATGRDPVYVGRVRRDPTIKNGFHLWVVSDNLRKGAALNGVQIAETLLQKNLL